MSSEPNSGRPEKSSQANDTVPAPQRREIPLKWVVYAILGFALLQTFLLYISV
ncbi:MAG: hypothetical protein ACFCU4_02950 [Puniceicoccaceae bacterium]